MRLIVLFLLSVLAVCAEQRVLRIPWEQSPAVLADKHVEVRLDGGRKVQGRWISVSGNAFTLETKRGLEIFSRSSIQSVRAGKRRVRGRVIGVLAGYFGTVALASAVIQNPEALQSGWSFGVIGATIAGYFIGRSYDLSTQQVLLIP